MADRFFGPDKAASAAPAPRVALVVGNGAYVQGPLQNPPRDAQSVGRALSDLGFECTILTDVGKQRLEEAIIDLGRRVEAAEAGGIGFFYFAGHGIQHEGKNYMV